MGATYQDFEDIQDHLPEEGESVTIYRKEGKLHTVPNKKPRGIEELEDSEVLHAWDEIAELEDFDDWEIDDEDIFDEETFGKLMVLDEKVSMAGGSKVFLYAIFIGSFVVCSLLWHLFSLGAGYWYLHLAAIAFVFVLAGHYCDRREEETYEKYVRSTLDKLVEDLDVSHEWLLSKMYELGDLSHLAENFKRDLARRINQ